jgi:hypothetical protein
MPVALFLHCNTTKAVSIRISKSFGVFDRYWCPPEEAGIAGEMLVGMNAGAIGRAELAPVGERRAIRR